MQRIDAQPISRFGNFIAGGWRQPTHGRYLRCQSSSVASNCEIARSDASDIEIALAAAQESAASWSKLARETRWSYLKTVGEELQTSKVQLGMLYRLSSETNISQSLKNSIFPAIHNFRYAANVSIARSDASQMEQSVNVVKQIIPAGIDLGFFAWRIASVLAAGHCMVVALVYKSPTDVSSHQLAFVQMVGDLLPAGVFNLVNGLSLEVGTALADRFVDQLINCRHAV